MKRYDAIKMIGNIYDIEISNNDLKSVGVIYNTRKENEVFNHVLNVYNLLLYNLYQNNTRLINVTNIYKENNTIYYDLDYLRGCELI